MFRLLASILITSFLTCPLFDARAADKSIISIGGSVTEIVFALGAGDRLAAVDSTSLYPEDATTLPDVGYMRRLSAEPILAFEPDLVLAVADTGPAPVLEQLREAGIEIAIIDDEPSPAGVATKIEAVADALGLSKQGEALARRVTADFDALAKEVNRAATPLRVMFILNTGRGAPMIGGTATSADAIIRLAGAENAVSGLEGYKPLSPEAVIEVAPDVILAMNRSVEIAGGKDVLLAQPDIARTPAGRKQALISMEGLLLLGFGPRTPDAARQLAAELAALKQKPVN